MRVVLDSDGLIKLAKAGALERVVSAWTCLVPRAVYVETVERGLETAYPDAQTIRLALPSATDRRTARHPRAAALLQDKRGLGRGEQEALHLFFAARGDAIVTDDAAFVAMLASAGLRYLVPALVLVRLVQEQHFEPAEALDCLERMRPFIRAEVYRAAWGDLTTV
ncbi:MAG: hypothetical protein ACREKH_08260 [Candidatus Rokuibacteriota bacterium]